MTSNHPARVLVLGAHPDDAEFHAGGLLARHAKAQSAVRIVSVTNGAAGHYRTWGPELAAIRRREAAEAGQVIGAEYVTWDFPDGALMPSIEVRHEIIREIRRFKPDMVLTHRPNDYHPDHRAVGQAVQDASYLVTVPSIVPDAPALRTDPIVAYMVDLFTRPCPMRPDIVLDIGPELATIVSMLACHHSQVFDWLPWHEGILDQVPADDAERRAWLKEWFVQRAGPRLECFRDALIEACGEERANRIELCEVYEISEYAGWLADDQRRRLFPSYHVP